MRTKEQFLTCFENHLTKNSQREGDDEGMMAAIVYKILLSTISNLRGAFLDSVIEDDEV